MRYVPNAAAHADVEAEALAAEPADLAPPGALGFAEPVARRDPVGAMATVRENLESLVATTCTGGAVAVRWTVFGLLTCIGLAYCLKPNASLAVVLAWSASLFFGPGGAELADDIRSGRIALPSRELLRQARIRLDVLAILFERSLHRQFKFMRYILADASPQLGKNFLCTREERIRYPRAEYSNPQFITTYDLNEGFESRIAPVSIIGAGFGSGLKKTYNVSGIFLMESEDPVDFEEVRCEVMGMTTDQGPEKSMHDEIAGVVDFLSGKYSSADAKAYLWPHVLYVAGHMHLLWNALEETCKAVSCSQVFLMLFHLCACS